MPAPVSGTSLALINGGVGALMAARGYTAGLAAAVIIGSEVAGIAMMKMAPNLIAPTKTPYGPANFIADTVVGLAGWFLVAAFMEQPPNVYDAVPDPFRLR